MENIFIEATDDSPEISLNSDARTIQIAGNSYCENIKIFYAPVIEWIENFLKENSSQEKITFNFDLTYFNSGSSKIIMDLFELLDGYADNQSIIINWIYDEQNEVALEYGEELSEDLEHVSFNLVAK
jgi:hypothetical protein